MKKTREKKGPKCYNCGKIGHIAKDCRSKSKEQAQTVLEKEINLITESKTNRNKDESNLWIGDSGATCHMCNTREYMYDMETKKRPSHSCGKRRRSYSHPTWKMARNNRVEERRNNDVEIITSGLRTRAHEQSLLADQSDR